ncbi:predicted protein [Botrytis cinerea T4]|uniref:Uncharacterized protein n=1 Tax=Botryotinia fuckeliana (strain T4) TaxID=999810 RepID=G2XZ35_BOTF4|nr:predicted protein [Botrytis cinerea T4]
MTSQSIPARHTIKGETENAEGRRKKINEEEIHDSRRMSESRDKLSLSNTRTVSSDDPTQIHSPVSSIC